MMGAFLARWNVIATYCASGGSLRIIVVSLLVVLPHSSPDPMRIGWTRTQENTAKPLNGDSLFSGNFQGTLLLAQ